ncbi:hypothetical protein [Halobellus limi]|nr:hypothetical protein [Halobellus limi]
MTDDSNANEAPTRRGYLKYGGAFGGAGRSRSVRATRTAESPA